MHLIPLSGAIALCALFGSHALGLSLWPGIAIGTALHVFLALGIFHPAPSWVCPTITRMRNVTARVVALTFDDGPSPSITPAVLKILADRRVPATFFCIGRAARRHGDIVRAVAEAGHELGNHSYFHPRHIYAWTRRALSREIDVTQRVMVRAAGVSPVVYRPPVGFRSLAMARVLREKGLLLVNFSARAYDTRGGTPGAIVRRISRSIAPGAIILLHDGDDRHEHPDRSAMLEALPDLLDAIIAAGYRFVTVSDLIAESSVDGPVSRAVGRSGHPPD